MGGLGKVGAFRRASTYGCRCSCIPGSRKAGKIHSPEVFRDQVKHTCTCDNSADLSLGCRFQDVAGEKANGLLLQFPKDIGRCTREGLKAFS